MGSARAPLGGNLSYKLRPFLNSPQAVLPLSRLALRGLEHSNAQLCASYPSTSGSRSY